MLGRIGVGERRVTVAGPGVQGRCRGLEAEVTPTCASVPPNRASVPPGLLVALHDDVDGMAQDCFGVATRAGARVSPWKNTLMEQTVRGLELAALFAPAVASIVTAFWWPAAVFGIAVICRKQLRDLIGCVETFEGAEFRFFARLDSATMI